MDTEEWYRFRAEACGGYPGRGYQERISRLWSSKRLLRLILFGHAVEVFGAASTIAGKLTVFGLEMVVFVEGVSIQTKMNIVEMLNKMLKAVEASTIYVCAKSFAGRASLPRFFTFGRYSHSGWPLHLAFLPANLWPTTLIDFRLLPNFVLDHSKWNESWHRNIMFLTKIKNTCFIDITSLNLFENLTQASLPAPLRRVPHHSDSHSR